jgi:hypothetical protein
MWIVRKNLVCTSQNTHGLSVIKTNLLTMFEKNVTSFYIHINQINSSCGRVQSFFKAIDADGHQSAVKVLYEILVSVELFMWYTVVLHLQV